MPRTDRITFVFRLRELLFSDPHRFTALLQTDQAAIWVRSVWREMNEKFGDEEKGLETVMEVENVKLRDGRLIAVIKMPPPEQSGEAYILGIVFPPAISEMDVLEARKSLRLFVLNRFGGPDDTRDTDLCAWMIQRGKMQHLTYNVDAPKDVAELGELGW